MTSSQDPFNNTIPYLYDKPVIFSAMNRILLYRSIVNHLIFGICLTASELAGFLTGMAYGGESSAIFNVIDSESGLREQTEIDFNKNQWSSHQPKVKNSISVFEESLPFPETQEQTPVFTPLSQTEPSQPLPSQEFNLQERTVESNQRLTELDPELGSLRLRELEQPPPPSEASETIFYLLGRVGYFKSDNVFSLAVDPIDDDLIWTGLTFLATPSLGENTTLLAGVSGNIIRYGGDRTDFDYEQLRFNVSVRQQLTNEISGEVGWTKQQLFDAESGDRFLDENSVFVEFDREDQLTEVLVWDTFYQFRAAFANPNRRSQIINTVGTSLSYYPVNSLELALDYQFTYTDFTQQDRNDSYHQLVTRLSYAISDNSQAYLFGGRSFGNSSDSMVDFDGFIFGVGVNFVVPWK
ncbi:MAG: hypothetical protein ACOC04_02835 [Halothece sp.]